MTNELAGQTVVLIGGSAGIGLETARRPAISLTHSLSRRSGGVYPCTSIRLRVSACKHSPREHIDNPGRMGW
jgi:hypothetical protein